MGYNRTHKWKNTLPTLIGIWNKFSNLIVKRFGLSPWTTFFRFTAEQLDGLPSVPIFIALGWGHPWGLSWYKREQHKETKIIRKPPTPRQLANQPLSNWGWKCDGSELGAKMAPEYVKLVTFRVKFTNPTLSFGKQRDREGTLCHTPEFSEAEPASAEASRAPGAVFPLCSIAAVPEVSNHS